LIEEIPILDWKLAIAIPNLGHDCAKIFTSELFFCKKQFYENQSEDKLGFLIRVTQTYTRKGNS